MRAVFMGSATLACPSLKVLMDSDSIDLAAVVCQPDRLRGRGRKVIGVCPTKQMALEAGCEVLSPENVNSHEFFKVLSGYSPDLIVVVAYGQIFGSDILNLPAKGCINLHTSLLPAYRGAAPIQWALANGEKVTGVTTMFMDEGMDTGPIIEQKQVHIEPDDTAGTLHDKIADAGAALLAGTVRGILNGAVKAVPQDDSKATLAPKLNRNYAKIDWNMAAVEIECRVRGFNPAPGCWTRFDSRSNMMGDEGKSLKIWKSEVVDMTGRPGEILDASGAGPVIASGNKALRMIEVQPEGGKIMAAADYARGHIGISGNEYSKG